MITEAEQKVWKDQNGGPLTLTENRKGLKYTITRYDKQISLSRHEVATLIEMLSRGLLSTPEIKVPPCCQRPGLCNSFGQQEDNCAPMAYQDKCDETTPQQNLNYSSTCSG